VNGEKAECQEAGEKNQKVHSSVRVMRAEMMDNKNRPLANAAGQIRQLLHNPSNIHTVTLAIYQTQTYALCPLEPPKA